MAMKIEVNEVPICSGSMSHTYNPRTGERFSASSSRRSAPRSEQLRASIPPPRRIDVSHRVAAEHSRMLPNAVCLPPPTHLACDCPVQVLLSDEARIILVLILESLHREPRARSVRTRSPLAHEAHATHHLPLLAGSAGAAKKAKNESVISTGRRFPRTKGTLQQGSNSPASSTQRQHAATCRRVIVTDHVRRCCFCKSTRTRGTARAAPVAHGGCGTAARQP
jgi:hypothetical protein